jgi:lipopolysaccharide export system permease protein
MLNSIFVPLAVSALFADFGQFRALSAGDAGKVKIGTMSILRRSLMREMLLNGAAALLVLISITATTLLIRAVGRAAVGKWANEAMLPLLGFGVLNALPALISIAVFVGILMTLVRSFRDSEMIVWFSSGLSPLELLRPALLFAAPAVVAIAVCSLAIGPWATHKREEYQRWLASQDEASLIAPGMFAESKRQDRVYFVEAMQETGNVVRNVFMQTMENGRLGIVVATKGYRHETENGDRYLVLEQGRRYEGVPGRPDFRMVEFERYWTRIESYATDLRNLRPSTRNTGELLRNPSPENMAEWALRLGYPISALVLAMMAIPLSFVSPRAGRSFNLLLALLVYATYNNLLGLSQAWVGQEKLSLVTAMLAVHGLMAVILVVLFYWRLRVRPTRLRG